MTNPQSLLQLPELVLRQIIEYLPTRDRLTFRVVSQDAKVLIDDSCSIIFSFSESNGNEKIEISRNLKISTLRVYGITPRHLPLQYPENVKNLYLYGDVDETLLQGLLHQTINLKKLKIYGDVLEKTPQNFKNDLIAFKKVEDLRLFHSYDNDPISTSINIQKILDFTLPEVKSLSIDFYGCPYMQTKNITEKILTFLLSHPKLTSLKLRLQETVLEGQDDIRSFSAEEIMKAFERRVKDSNSLKLTKFHLFAEIQDIHTWIPTISSLKQAISINIRFLKTNDEPNGQLVLNEIYKQIFTTNSETLTEVRLGELCLTNKDNRLNSFDVTVLCQLPKLKILKLSRSMDDILYNQENEETTPFLVNVKCLPKTLQRIIFIDCTMNPDDVEEMLNGMTNLRQITVTIEEFGNGDTGMSHAHVHKIMTQNQLIQYIEIKPVRPIVGNFIYTNALLENGVVETIIDDGKIALSFCKAGFIPKNYAE